MPMPKRLKQNKYRPKLTRGQRKLRRLKAGLLGVSGKGARRMLAGLRRTDSGILTRKAKQTSSPIPEKKTKTRAERAAEAERYHSMKRKKAKGKLLGKGAKGQGANRRKNASDDVFHLPRIVYLYQINNINNFLILGI